MTVRQSIFPWFAFVLMLAIRLRVQQKAKRLGFKRYSTLEDIEVISINDHCQINSYIPTPTTNTSFIKALHKAKVFKICFLQKKWAIGNTTTLFVNLNKFPHNNFSYGMVFFQLFQFSSLLYNWTSYQSTLWALRKGLRRQSRNSHLRWP